MNGELEQRLLALGTALDVPSAPDTVPAVLSGLPARRRRTRPARMVPTLVVAAILLLAGAAMAVPPSRVAILQVLGLRGVRIERVPRLPAIAPNAKTGRTLALGRQVPVARARQAAGFRALLPPHASAAYLAHDVPGGRISFLVGSVLITEFRGTAQPFILKVLDPGTNAKVIRVNSAKGVYLSGAPHQVLFGASNGQVRSDRVRLAGNVLVWGQGPVIVRIEGTRTLAEALAIARTLRR